MRLDRTITRAMIALRSNYIAVASVAMTLLVVLVVYWQDLSILFNEALRSEALSQIILIPFLVSYLIYRKRELVKASLELEKFHGKATLVSVSDFIGIAFCLTAFLLYWYGSYTFYPLEYHIASIIIFVIGVTLILTNLKTLKVLIFPILFLVFLVPPPSNLMYTAGGFLAHVNTQGSYNLLKIAGLPVSLTDKFGAPVIALNTSQGPVEFAVYQASSGLYSLLAFATFAVFLVYITRGSLTKKTALFAIGFFILPILNITRISIIVSVAYWLGQGAADIVHAFSGWLLVFVAILLLLLIGERIFHLKIFGGSSDIPSCSECVKGSKKQEPFCLSCGKFPKTTRVKISKKFWIKVTALLVGAYLVTVSLQAPAFAFAPGLTLSSSNPQTETNAFPEIDGYELQFLYRDVNYERIAGQDASLVYAYLSQNSSSLPVYVLVGVSTSLSNLHNWEVSWIAYRVAQGQPPLVTSLESMDIQLTENPRIIARWLVFQHPSNYTYIALYWYQQALFNTGLTVESRYIRINLLVLTKNPNDATQYKEKLISMGQSVVAYWEPLRVQSLVSIAIPTQQILLGSTVFAAIFIQTSQYALEQKKKKTNLRIFERIAPQNEKLLYKTIKELSQKTKETTTQNIASALEKAVDNAVKPNEIVDMINNLEKQGLIKADIINMQDQPKLVWKP